MNKKTLVILPGWGGSSTTWDGFTQIAGNDFDIKVLNLPCFGDEPAPKEVWGVEDYADFVRMKIEALNPSSEIILLGHSFGGQVAAYLAAKHTGICEKLILCAAAVVRPTNTVKNTFFGVLSTAGKYIFSMPILWRTKRYAEKVLYKLADSPDYKKTNGVEREIFKKVIRQDMQHVLNEISVPTLVVWGKHDTYTPLRQGKLIAKQIPNATFVLINEAKHGIHLQTPERLLEVIKKFAYT